MATQASCGRCGTGRASAGPARSWRQQLCDAGLNVMALERGPWRDTPTDFATSFAQDELRYMWRHHLFQNVSPTTP